VACADATVANVLVNATAIRVSPRQPSARPIVGRASHRPTIVASQLSTERPAPLARNVA
jgi:hypothetical protein